MSLNVKLINASKPKDKLYRLSDGRGLCLEVPTTGNKRWRFRYRFEGNAKMLSLGLYPDVSLAEARDKCEEKRRVLASGVDPGEVRKQEKAQLENTFEGVAREWYEKFSQDWSGGHAETVISRLSKDVFPQIGNRPITELGPTDMLRLVQRIEKRGAVEVARRVRQILSQVFRYAIVTERADRDPAADIQGALPPATKVKHHASITEPKKIGGLLRAIDAYDGTMIGRCALRLAPLVFLRPGELRKAEWAELDLDAAEWRIPAEKMKMRQPHIVPLSRQALEVLRDIREVTGNGRYVFPSVRTDTRPMSDNTVNAALRRLGYSKDEMTCHGFRSMASTVLNEQGWNRDVIERQLAHSPRDKVRATYNFAEYLPKRREMMQAWADYLDGLKAGATVVSIGVQRMG
ncbi:MAG: tyrosine-type recombinase/integrase [Proteobacteria bacterium]|nr:tyrosine-type recombinase/integrase [Pseudomonadota bacterium]